MPVIYPHLKPLVDVVVGTVLMLLLSPVMLVATVAIRITSPGRALFVQERGGRDGVPFHSFKLRTMRTDHVHNPKELVPLTHAGVTPVGLLLRRLKIDELPQLLNVQRGDMSIVGPRPTIMDQVERYDAFQRRRLEVRPGITGLAQVNGSAATSWDERIRYDVYYVDHITPWLDLAILAKTLLVLALGEDRFARPFDQSPYAERRS